MHRIDTSTAQLDKFGAGKNGFTTGDPQSGTPATEVSADILDALQEEIAAVIEDPDSGLTLNKSNNGQLIEAIKKIVTAKAAPDASETQKGIARFATATESADAASGTLSVPAKHLPAVIAKYAPVAGGYRALKLSADGASANVVISAEQLVLDAVGGSGSLLAKNVAVTAVASASGINGLDTGALAASTWYSVWVISNGTTIASLLSLSATAPTMPAGYTYRRRVGCVYITSSNLVNAFKQVGDQIQLIQAILASAGNVDGLVALPIPVSAYSAHLGVAWPGNSASSVYIFVAPDNLSGYNENNAPACIKQSASVGSAAGCVSTNILLTHPQRAYCKSTAGVDSKMFCYGWRDVI